METVFVNKPLTRWQIYIQCRGNCETRERLFRTIWDGYHKRLLFFIRNYEGAEVEDIFQEVMMKVFQKIEKFNPLFSFNTWIYTIARNHCINHLSKRKMPMATEDPDTSLSASVNASQEDKVIRKELHLEIDRILATFSEDNQQIAFLRYYEGMTHREIARIMDIPTGTVKSRLHTSRAILKKALEAYDER